MGEEAWTLSFEMCAIQRATVGWKHSTDAASWPEPFIAPAALILLFFFFFKTNSGFIKLTLLRKRRQFKWNAARGRQNQSAAVQL